MSGARVALAGATGNLGPFILSNLLDAGHEVVVLTRPDSKSKLPSHPNITIAEVDYTSTPSITPHLSGVMAVISNINPVVPQQPLIDASIAAGVSRFIPSEFGSDTLNPKAAVIPILAGKVAVQDYLKTKVAENPGFSYTVSLTYNLKDSLQTNDDRCLSIKPSSTGASKRTS